MSNAMPPITPATSASTGADRIDDNDVIARAERVRALDRSVLRAVKRVSKEMGWKPHSPGRLRYSYFVRADKDGFEAVAIGAGPVLGGDLWRIGNTGAIEHLVDGCR